MKRLRYFLQCLWRYQYTRMVGSLEVRIPRPSNNLIVLFRDIIGMVMTGDAVMKRRAELGLKTW